MSNHPYYPYQWSLSSDCSTNLKVQNKDGNKPASCEEIIPTGGQEYCNQYVGYYPDNNNDRPEFHHCQEETFGDGCRDALIEPTPCRIGMYNTEVDFNDKSADETMGWTCEKPPGDNRTKLAATNPSHTYNMVNPIISNIHPARPNLPSKEINFNNICGNSWGNDWALRCKDKGSVWPKCNTVKNKGNCEKVIGCKWDRECVPQTCADMIQSDLVCDSELCNWNPECSNPNICGPAGPPPRGLRGRGSTREI